MTATKPPSTAATYRRCAAAIEKAIAAIQADPALFECRGKLVQRDGQAVEEKDHRNTIVELAIAAKQLDR